MSQPPEGSENRIDAESELRELVQRDAPKNSAIDMDKVTSENMIRTTTDNKDGTMEIKLRYQQKVPSFSDNKRLGRFWEVTITRDSKEDKVTNRRWGDIDI
jgi:vacuolar-type H+-ATPase subunit B/Vma2